MRSESQGKRYRDGYAAGQRDGDFESGIEVESQRRHPTGDDDSDAGYSAGFSDRRQARRDGAMRQSADLLERVPGFAQVSGWLKRLAARSQ